VSLKHGCASYIMNYSCAPAQHHEKLAIHHTFDIIISFLKGWSCYINFFQACKLKLRDLKGALLDADFALRETDGNAKAFFRQGQVGSDLVSYRFRQWE
jgi:hypothetical protein